MTEEAAEIEGTASEIKEKIKKRGGDASNQAFNNQAILDISAKSPNCQPLNVLKY